MSNGKPLSKKDHGNKETQSEDLIQKWLGEYGYDARTGTVKVPIKPGYFRFLVGFALFNAESPKEVLSSMIESALEAGIQDLDPLVRDAIKKAYFSEDA